MNGNINSIETVALYRAAVFVDIRVVLFSFYAIMKMKLELGKSNHGIPQ